MCPTRWTPPVRFDEYRLVRPLGGGVMSQVFLAHDDVLDRPVAVKFLLSAVSLAKERDRLLLEARALARLHHPNVAAIYRIGEVEAHPYLVSEYVRGKNLAEVDKPVAWPRALAIGVGLARGLSAVHRRGILHRDVKLSNVLLSDEDGEAKLIDFGLAKLGKPPEDPDDLDGTGTPRAEADASSSGRRDGVVGTPLYLAPELWRGAPASPRSDLYALGVLLYWLCSGRAPYQAPTVHDLGTLVLSREPTPLAELVPDIDRRLANAIDQCLRQDARLRFASADELREALDRTTSDRGKLPVPEGNPYRGLSAFRSEHRALFFGRDAEVHAVVDRLRTDPIVVVAGESGVGKSSLCHAGVVPLIAAGALGPAWSVTTLIPGRTPLRTLARALEHELATDPDALSRSLETAPEVVGRALREAHWNAGNLVIVVDQLEELVTLSEPAEADAFCRALSALTETAKSVRLLFSVRADFVARAALLPGIGDEVTRSLYFLKPLGPEGLRAAIVEPARAHGVVFQPELLQLLETEAARDVSLPLLQFALAELWEKRDVSRRVIALSAFDEIGGVAGALARHADTVLTALGTSERAASRRILTRLVAARGTRMRLREEDLGVGDRPTRSALDALVRGRLIAPRETDGGTTFELAHEALIGGWATLGGWLAADADRRAIRERLAAATAEWERVGRAKDALWSERQLAEWREEDTALLAPREAEFVQASRAHHRSRRRLRVAAVVSMPLVLAGIVAASRLEASRESAALVRGHLALAESNIAEAARTRIELETLERAAFHRFDLGELTEAEVIWARAVELAPAVEHAYARASQALETALLIEPGDEEVRRRFAALLGERALFADARHEPAIRDELLARLDVYDHTQRTGTSKARLAVHATVPGARVAVSRYALDARKHRVPNRVATATAPMDRLELEPGSYLVELQAAGHDPLALPVVLGRGETLDVVLDPPAHGTVPPGFVLVPRGRFSFGTNADEGLRRQFLSTVPLHPVETEAYLIGVREVTYAEWLEFLAALPAAEREKRTPKVAAPGFNGGLALEKVGPGPGDWKIALQPTTHSYRAGPREMITYSRKERSAPQNWLEFPVSGISFEDATAYAAWLDRSGRVPRARLCTEREWERAARGADDREYPHGDALDPSDANYDETYGKEPLAFGPDAVGSHPRVKSPFGLDDMAGNVWEWTISVLPPARAVAKGGAYYHDKLAARSTNRLTPDPSLRDLTLGLRVCADPPTSFAKK